MKKILPIFLGVSLLLVAEESNSFKNNPIFTRRSIRRYSPQQVEDEKIDILLRAGMQGPSGWHQAPFEFIVVKDREKLENLSKVGPYLDAAEKAPAAIVVIKDEENAKDPKLADYDVSIAAHNILLQAVEEGLGSVWLSISPYEDRMASVREILNIPEGKDPFAILPIGYPRIQKNTFVDEYKPEKVHYGVYGNQTK